MLSLCTSKETGKQLERGKQILNLPSSDYKYIYNIRIYTHIIYMYTYTTHIIHTNHLQTAVHIHHIHLCICMKKKQGKRD